MALRKALSARDVNVVNSAHDSPGPTISFIVPVRNDARRLAACLDRIRRNDYPSAGMEIIVVDHESIDDSARVACATGARVLSVLARTVADVRNQGARAARGRILAFVDADHEIDRAWARCAVETLDEDGTGAAGAPYDAPRHGTWVQRAYDGLRSRKAGRREVGWLGSGNLAVRAAAFRSVDGFDATLESCEDVDLCARLRAAGYRIVSDDRLRSVHLGDPRTLGALFRGELWRGRDNLRIGLRGPFAWRDVPSIVIPVIDLAGLALLGAGVVALPVGGLRPAAAGLAVVGGLASLRAVRMLACRRSYSARSVLDSFIVACVYDVARALAIVLRATHETRRATRAD